MKFKKIIALGNIELTPEANSKLKDYCEEIYFYKPFLKEDKELIEIIGDSDCLLVSWETVVSKTVIENCKKLKYIGMCCSLYDEKSANVDIKAAREKGITVLGVRDYGDNGLIEYVISELIRLLNGYGEKQWKKTKYELTDLKAGIIGLGTTGLMLARALRFFGADVYYYSRNKKDYEDEGIKYLYIDDLLSRVDVISTHLPKNSIVLTAEKFELYGNNKILINTSIGPTYEIDALRDWLKNPDNYLICDKVGAGDYRSEFMNMNNVIYTDKTSGQTNKSIVRLSEGVLGNIRKVLSQI